MPDRAVRLLANRCCELHDARARCGRRRHGAADASTRSPPSIAKTRATRSTRSTWSAKTVIEQFAETLGREQSFVLVAEGLPGGQRCVPDGNRRSRRHLAHHRRPDRRHARPDVPEAQRLDPDRRGAESRPGDLAAGHRAGGPDRDSAGQAAPRRSAVGGPGRRRRGACAQPADRRTRAAAAASVDAPAALRTASRPSPLLPRSARRAGALDEAIVRGALGASRSRQGALLRGSVRVDRWAAVRADRGPRSLHRRSAAADAPLRSRPRAAAAARLPSVRHLLRAHRRGERRDRDRPARSSARRAAHGRRRRRVGRLREREDPAADRAAAAAGTARPRLARAAEPA